MEKDPQVAASFMRASDYNAAVFGHVISMPKLNGLRCMWIPGRGFFTREGIQWRPEVLAHIQPAGDLILDGELYCHGMALQQINSAVGINRLGPGDNAEKVSFNVFDNVGTGNALDRMLRLGNLRGPGYQVVHWERCLTRIDVDRFYEQYISQGYEGQILKSVYGAYIPQGTNKRATLNLQRRKAFVHGEFKCIGVELSDEPRIAGLVGALVFHNPKGPSFKVGTGFDDILRREWVTNPPVGRIATLRYLYLSKDGIPNNSSFEDWREGT
jgi:ATP-dependent DNA ligase